MIMFNPRHPAVIAAGLSLKPAPANPATVISKLSHLRRLARWAEANGMPPQFAHWQHDDLRRARPGCARAPVDQQHPQLHRNPENAAPVRSRTDRSRTAKRPLARQERPRSIRDRTPCGRIHSRDPARAVVSVDPRRLDLRPHLRSGHPASTAALRRTHRRRREEPRRTTTRDSTDTSPTPPIPSPFTRQTANSTAEVHWSLLAMMLGSEHLTRSNVFRRDLSCWPSANRPRRGSDRSRTLDHHRRHRWPRRRHSTTTAPASPGIRGSTRALSGWNGACCATPAMSWSWAYR